MSPTDLSVVLRQLCSAGGTFHRKTGNIHVTIRARIWNGENGYSNWDNVVPITAALLGGLTLGAGALAAGGVALAAVGLAAIELPAWLTAAAVTGAQVYSYGEQTETLNITPTEI